MLLSGRFFVLWQIGILSSFQQITGGMPFGQVLVVV